VNSNLSTSIAARRFAFAAHDRIEHRRKYTDLPYTTHLEAVAELVKGAGGSEEMIAAAYLHDCVEDAGVTLDELRVHFGDDVAYLVEHLTDVSRPCDGKRAARKALDRAHVAAGDARVHTIKLADLIDNAGSILEHDPSFAAIYLEEKRLLLEVLRDGDGALLARASEIVERGLASLQLDPDRADQA
jgi:(p)ppGpp synthase/HD superfamily hydrolase